METKFQTSFIPKKPLVSEKKAIMVKGGTSILMIIATIIFLVSIASAVFSVVWANVLTKNQETYRQQLANMESRFPLADIEHLKKVNTKIDLGKKLLKNHLAVEEVFSILGQLTVEGVYFNSFTFSAPENNSGDINISLSGVAKNLFAIAYQSDIFGDSSKYGKNKILKNPVMSDVSESSTDGTIGFSFSASINPNDLLFEKLLEPAEAVGENTTQSI